MDNNLITENFTDNIDISIISKTLTFVKFILWGIMAYSILQGIYWILLIRQGERSYFKTDIAYYFYQVIPFIQLFVLAISILTWYFILKAHKLILFGISNNDATSFNRGYNFFYRSVILTFISFLITFIAICIQLYFYLN